ncbi:MAG: VTT domain-containing protein [Thaumarchaeota archaeon]|nr:VTT domain-containing protein [Nitrososphaerota archaeon]
MPLYDWLVDTFSNLLNVILDLGYKGALISGFLSSSTFTMPIFPSFIVVPLLSTQLNPLLVGLLAGVGAGFGQFIAYFIGLGGRRVLSESRRRTMEKWRSKMDRWGIILIFVLAATPFTPDDLLWFPLGMMKYPRLKALAASVSGKVILNVSYAYAGVFGWAFLKDLLL